MNYEKRFKRFIADLLAVIEKHMISWDKAERGISDVDAIMERAEAMKDMPSEPVFYGKDTGPGRKYHLKCDGSQPGHNGDHSKKS